MPQTNRIQTERFNISQFKNHLRLIARKQLVTQAYFNSIKHVFSMYTSSTHIHTHFVVINMNIIYSPFAMVNSISSSNSLLDWPWLLINSLGDSTRQQIQSLSNPVAYRQWYVSESFLYIILCLDNSLPRWDARKGPCWQLPTNTIGLLTKPLGEWSKHYSKYCSEVSTPYCRVRRSLTFSLSILPQDQKTEVQLSYCRHQHVLCMIPE